MSANSFAYMTSVSSTHLLESIRSTAQSQAASKEHDIKLQKLDRDGMSHTKRRAASKADHREREEAGESPTAGTGSLSIGTSGFSLNLSGKGSLTLRKAPAGSDQK